MGAVDNLAGFVGNEYASHVFRSGRTVEQYGLSDERVHGGNVWQFHPLRGGTQRKVEAADGAPDVALQGEREIAQCLLGLMSGRQPRVV